MFINNSIKKGILISVMASSILLLAGCSHAKEPFTKNPFITVWDVNSSNKNITIPINPKYAGDYNYTVTWGDGNISKDINDTITHTYSKDGNYTVKINGAFPAIYLNGNIQNHDKLIEIKQWGDIKWKSFKHAFAGANDLKIIAADTPNLKNVKDMSGAFANDDTNTFNNINNWNVSNVTDMSYMFNGASAFNQPLNKWNVSKITDMNEMFAFALAFNQPLNNWNVSNVTDMSYMFKDASAFNQPLNKWDVSRVTDMNEMFAFALAFNQPLNKWNVSKITDMNEMFAFAFSFNQPLNKWNISKVTDYESFAYGCPINGTSKMPKFSINKQVE